jgi:hypothetical protein
MNKPSWRRQANEVFNANVVALAPIPTSEPKQRHAFVCGYEIDDRLEAEAKMDEARARSNQGLSHIDAQRR